MNQTTIEKANSIIKKIEELKEFIEISTPSNNSRMRGIGVGHISCTRNSFKSYYLYELYEGTNDKDSWNNKLHKAAMDAMYNEALRLLEEAEVELINIGVVTIRETPKVKTSKLKKILNKIF